MVCLDATSDTVLIWVMIFMNLSFLIFHLALRRQQRVGLRLSDLFAVNAFLVILVGTSLVTYGNVQEMEYMKENPLGPLDPRTGMPNPRLDPVVFGFPSELRKRYGQMFYASLVLNTSALWITKAAFVAFYYEIFPKHSHAIRYSLHATAVYVGCTGVASFMEGAFWCWPISRAMGGSLEKLCTAKLDPSYNASTFGMHVSSTLIIAILPLLLVGKVELRGRELTFVATMVFLGVLSFAGSISALATTLTVRIGVFRSSVKHAIYVSTLADQNAMFLAACLSPLRLRVGRKVVLENAPLVIEVEKTWNVDFEIVECWGHRPGDPFGSDLEMRTEILAGGNETFASKDMR